MLRDEAHFVSSVQGLAFLCMLGLILGKKEKNVPPACCCLSSDALCGSVFDHIELASTDVLLDLGCGDGRWVIAAAAQRSCPGRGYDLNEELLQKGRRAAAEAGVRAVRVDRTAAHSKSGMCSRGFRQARLDIAARNGLAARYDRTCCCCQDVLAPSLGSPSSHRGVWTAVPHNSKL